MRWRWPIIAAWLLAASLSLLALPQVGSILRAGGFSADGIEAEEAFERYEQDFGDVGSPIQIAFHHDEWLATDEAFAAEAARVLAPLTALPNVMRVSTYQDNPTQIAPGGHTAYATLFFDLHPDVAHRIVPELRERLAPSELDIHIAGSPVYYSDIQTLSESDLQRAETVGLPFALIVLVLVFGSVVAAGIPVLAGGASVVVGLALLWLFGQQVGFSIFALNVVTLVGLGLGADYSLILVSRFREELAAGRSVHDAVPRTVATAGKAVVFSGAAVLTGLASLMVFEFMMLRSIGAGGALVVLIAVAAATTFVPALLAVLGPRVNRWRVWRPRIGPQNGWARLARAVMRRPLPIFLGVSAFLVVLGLPFLHVRLNAPDARVLTPDSPSRVAYEFLRDEFGEGHQTPLFLVARFPAGALAPEAVAAQHALTGALEADPRVARVGGITALDPRITLEQYQLLYGYAPGIGDPWARALAETFTRENAAFMLVEPSVPSTSPEAEGLVEAIRAYRDANGLDLLVGGGAAGLKDFVDRLYTDFPKAVLLILVITYVVLAVLFRSVVLPLKAVLLNVLSLLASFGALVLVFQDGWLSNVLRFEPLGYIDSLLPVVLFAMLFGLSMDYEVFLLSRVKEAHDEGRSNTESVAIGMERSGRVVTSAALVVIAVCLAFVTADIVLIKALGLGAAIAVFVDAAIVRALLVPATMHLLGSWNWWAPSLRRPRLRSAT
ncbi:MAG: MMPL family transporter [Chloroflexota bacterium]|nr:MMPL family transporter [Chloroflexota bacterium]